MGRALSLMVMAWVVPARSLADRPADPRPRPTVPPAGGGCIGRWQGWGRGSSGQPWSIDMVVRSTRAARCGTIEYPSLGCGGYLVDCQRRGDTVTFTEVYTHNPGTCAPAGAVEARCEGATMQWVWTGYEVVRTTLRRM